MLKTLAAFVIIGLLILIHELGHFFWARLAGVRILCLSIGFGPKLFTWKRGHTEYTISAIPLGGYVKMAGEQESERRREPWEFLSKSVATRLGIVFAGPLMNYVLAVVCLWVVLVTGFPQLLPVVGDVKAGMPAATVGLQEGDRIVAIDEAPIDSWDDLTDIISEAPDQALTLLIEREGEIARSIAITPKRLEITDPFGRDITIGRIGISPSGDITTVRFGPVESFRRTMSQHAEWMSQTLLGLYSMATGRISVKDSMTGPIGIVQMAGEAAAMGISSTLYFMSIISLMLAFFNLFPIPVLDGGHVLFLVIEGLRGRPVNIRIQERATQVGFALLLMLILVVCVNDVKRIWFSKDDPAAQSTPVDGDAND